MVSFEQIRESSQVDDNMVVIAAVKVVLPWSTWPIVPTFTCGFVRSNLPFAMIVFPSISKYVYYFLLMTASATFFGASE